MDLLWDVRQKLKLAMVNVRAEGVIGLLRRIDRSFKQTKATFRAANDDGYFVDLIRPFQPNEVTKAAPLFSKAEADLEAAAITGLQWLMNSPKFEQVAMGADGRPVWMSCVDPRAFALHKYWLSKQDSRDSVKRRRDAQQAKAVAQVASTYLNLRFEAKDLTALPIDMVRGAKDLVTSVRSAAKRTESGTS